MVSVPSQRFRSRRAGIFGKRENLAVDPGKQRIVQRVQFLPGSGFISSEYLATPAIVLQALGPVFLVGNTLLLASRLGNQAIPEALPRHGAS